MGCCSLSAATTHKQPAPSLTGYTLTLIHPYREGFSFLGWGGSRSGYYYGVADYQPGDVVENLTSAPNGTVTLYAIWEPDPTASTYSLRGDITASADYVKTYTYDISGNLTNFTLTNGGQYVHDTVYVYDALNRLTAVANWGVYEAQYTYDVNGNRQSVVYANGAREDYTYNKANWVTGLTNCSGGVVTSAYIYTYYASGNRRTELDYSGVTTTYTYDGLGRLTEENIGDVQKIQYTYDTAGNRTKMEVSGPEKYTTTYSYDANNRLTEEVETRGELSYSTLYDYDENGNLLKISEPNGAVINTYNDFNQLVSTSSGGIQTTYTYNAQGIRTSKSAANNTVKFLLDGGNVVGEVQSGVLTAAYLRGINLIRRVIMSGAEYYLFNGHGDVVGLTNSSGGVTQSYDYDAFGNEKNPDASDTNPFRYCGEYFDTETGTYYLRARYYDPEIGRFTQQDTHWSPANAIYGDNPRKVYEQTDALGLSTYTYAPEISAIMQSGNLYVYCVNNPMQYADPTGELFVSALLLGAVIGAAINSGFNVFGQLQEGKTLSTLNVESIVTSAAIGAVSGLVAGSAIHVGGQIAINALLSGAESLIQDTITGQDLNIQAALGKAILGGIAGAVGGHGAQYSKAINYEKIAAGGTIAKLKYVKPVYLDAAIKALVKGLAKSGFAQLAFVQINPEDLLGG